MRLISSAGFAIDDVGEAATFRARLIGWFDPRLGNAAGVLLHPCRAVHTFFMGGPIDVVFITAEKRVCRVVSPLGRNRHARCPDARYALELGAGMAAELGIREGQIFEFER